MLQLISDIAYRPVAGERGVGDLYLPVAAERAPLALTIHGGGWNSQDKSSFSGVAEFLCELGFAVFNINYRLLSAGPWPLCGDDCLCAAEFLLHGNCAELGRIDRSRLLVVGGSAGGHLALMTGLRLPREAVSAIVSISGVDDITLFPQQAEAQRQFFGGTPTAEQVRSAQPLDWIRRDQPPVLLTHYRNDPVVPCAAAENFAARSRAAGAEIEFYRYDCDTPDSGHSIWIPGSSPHRLFPDIEAAITRFLRTRRHSSK